MKQLFLILCLPILFNLSLMGQEQSAEEIQKELLNCVAEMGKDTASILNACESKYLNFSFQNERGKFDFHGRRVAFFKGNTGTIKGTKKDYLDLLEQFAIQNGFLLAREGQLIILNEEEIKETGYDAVVITMSKKLLTKKEVVKRLKKNR